MKNKSIFFLVLFLAVSMSAFAQNKPQVATADFDTASKSAQQKLQASIDELAKLREQTASETIPLSRKLNDLEKELTDVRLDYQQTTRLLDSRTLDLNNLQNEIKSRKEEASYLSNLLSEYNRNFESNLHITELNRYRDELEAAKLAPENSTLSEEQVYEAQAKLLTLSIDRLNDALGGARFKGNAIVDDGTEKQGTFLLLGPAALFRSDDGKDVGTAEQAIGSLEPKVFAFQNPEDSVAASKTVADASGVFPFDPTLGNAHKIEKTEETWVEHIKKGGPVMYPIFGLAGISLLVAFLKWLSFLFIDEPSKRRIRALLDAVAHRDQEAAKQQARLMCKAKPHPIGGWVLTAVVGAVFGTVAYYFLRIHEVETYVPNLVVFGKAHSLPFFVIGCAIAGGIFEFVLRLLFGYSPIGRMLEAGVEHLEYPPELIEEVMFEKVLAMRIRLDSFLSLIAISASAAPLLGLLGTVTGIINTFKLITVFGSGDVKTLSGGISEALITTEYGLITAIPALLIHGFLSRKARGVINHMEKAAVSLINQVSKTPLGEADLSKEDSVPDAEANAHAHDETTQIIGKNKGEKEKSENAGPNILPTIVDQSGASS